MKFLPHKQEDLSSSLRCHIKKSQVLWRVLTIPALGVINRSEKGGIPGFQCCSGFSRTHYVVAQAGLKSMTSNCWRYRHELPLLALSTLLDNQGERGEVDPCILGDNSNIMFPCQEC